MGELNSAVHILRLWELCLVHQDALEETHVCWSTLRKALQNGLGERVQRLDCNSVDDVLDRHFGGSEEGVNFIHYWQGMEVILKACNAYQEGGLDAETEQKVTSLRNFRDAILEKAATHPHIYPIHSLESLYLELARAPGTSGAVVQFWETRMSRIEVPTEGDDVTWDEIACALLTWLRELLEEDEDLHVESSPRGPVAAYGAWNGDIMQDSYMRNEAPAYRLPQVPGRDSSGGGSQGVSQRFRQWPADMLGQQPQVPTAPGGASSSSSSSSRSGSFSSPALPPWLAIGNSEEAADVRAFRDNIVQRLGDAELSLPRLYFAVRDVVRDRARLNESKRAGLILLSKAVTYLINNQVRGALRRLQSVGAGSSDIGAASPPEVDGGTLLVELICGQAESARTLSERATNIPYAYHVAWLLGRMRYQRLGIALSQWRSVYVQQEAAAQRGRTSSGGASPVTTADSQKHSSGRRSGQPTTPGTPSTPGHRHHASHRGQQPSQSSGVLYNF